jgi:mono/diheme cytochrome c family protein
MAPGSRARRVAHVAPWLALALVAARGGAATAGPDTRPPRLQQTDYHDGHARPRAAAFNPDDGRLYVTLSTTDELAIVDPDAARPRLLGRVRVCRFPAAVAPWPGGGALVACRFEPGLRRVTVARPASDARWRVSVLAAGTESGARGLALSPDRKLAYVTSPATGGVNVISLAGAGVVQRLATGLGPRALRVVPAGALPGERRALLLVSSFIDRKVTVHAIDEAGRPGAALQTIATEAPVLDLVVARASGTARPALWLLTHEDRPLSRPARSVEGLDSGVLVFPARGPGPSGAPFDDPGSGRRTFVNLSERAPEPVVELAAIARDDDTGALALVGTGTDNLLVGSAGATDPRAGTAVTVGAAPAAVVALPGPGARWVTADRLSDTLTFVGSSGASRAPQVLATLVVGTPERASRAERGELMFYSRALTPRNVADGALSLYTCAACHDDGHVDGRRHPAKRNRFFSMTKTCRGLGTTAPYLSLGEPTTIDAFADNIVATHAQGADESPDDYDRYPVTLRVREARAGAGWKQIVLSADEVRAALASYMVRIPPEPSPFVAPGRRGLTSEERRGLALFREHCAGCHQLVGDTALGNLIPPQALERRLLAGQVALASARLYDVGTPVLGKTGNNPPSLRGVWDAAPYFSDGSARTLDAVLARTDPSAEKVHAPINAERPPAFDTGARVSLLAFLRAL